MKILIVCIAIILSSCGSNREIRVALHMAGSNRVELQQVLDHYKNDPQKLKAAEFLIANMPGHYSYIPDKIVDFKRDYELIMSTDSLTIPEKQRMLEELSKKHDLNNCIDEDVRILSADFLIQDIDRSFEIWENEPYCQHLNFDQFCELILPYKVLELQEQDVEDVAITKYTAEVMVRFDEPRQWGDSWFHYDWAWARLMDEFGSLHHLEIID